MTDEEKAEEYKESKRLHCIPKERYIMEAQESRLTEIKQAFLAGLKAGKDMNVPIKWHKVADGDLPKYGYQVLSEEGVPVIYNHDTNRWFEYSPNADNIELRKWEEPIAWCEIPKEV